MVEVYAVELTSWVDLKKFYSFLYLLSPEKQSKIKRYINEKDAIRGIVAELIIRYIISRKFQIAFREIIFEYNKYGKPFLRSYPDFHFNISHSGDWIVFAIGNDPLGIDVEFIQSIDVTLFKKIFSEKEYNNLLTKTESERIPYFYELWTLKESYIKMIGKGLSFALKSFTVNSKNGRIELEDININCVLKQYDLDDNYKCSICTAGEEVPKCIVKKNLNQFYKYLKIMYNLDYVV